MSTHEEQGRRYLQSIFADGTCLTCCPPPSDTLIAFSDPSERGVCECRHPEDECLGGAYLYTIAPALRSESAPITGRQYLRGNTWDTRDERESMAVTPLDPEAASAVQTALRRNTELTMAQVLLSRAGYKHGPDEMTLLENLRPPDPEVSFADALKSVVRQARTKIPRNSPNTQPSDQSSPSSAGLRSIYNGFTEFQMRQVALYIEGQPDTATYRSYREKLQILIDVPEALIRRKAMAAAHTHIEATDIWPRRM